MSSVLLISKNMHLCVRSNCHWKCVQHEPDMPKMWFSTYSVSNTHAHPPDRHIHIPAPAKCVKRKLKSICLGILMNMQNSAHNWHSTNHSSFISSAKSPIYSNFTNNKKEQFDNSISIDQVESTKFNVNVMLSSVISTTNSTILDRNKILFQIHFSIIMPLDT